MMNNYIFSEYIVNFMIKYYSPLMSDTILMKFIKSCSYYSLKSLHLNHLDRLTPQHKIAMIDRGFSEILEMFENSSSEVEVKEYILDKYPSERYINKLINCRESDTSVVINLISKNLPKETLRKLYKNCLVGLNDDVRIWAHFTRKLMEHDNEDILREIMPTLLNKHDQVFDYIAFKAKETSTLDYIFNLNKFRYDNKILHRDDNPLIINKIRERYCLDSDGDYESTFNEIDSLSYKYLMISINNLKMEEIISEIGNFNNDMYSIDKRVFLNVTKVSPLEYSIRNGNYHDYVEIVGISHMDGSLIVKFFIQKPYETPTNVIKYLGYRYLKNYGKVSISFLNDSNVSKYLVGNLKYFHMGDINKDIVTAESKYSKFTKELKVPDNIKKVNNMFDNCTTFNKAIDFSTFHGMQWNPIDYLRDNDDLDNIDNSW